MPEKTDPEMDNPMLFGRKNPEKEPDEDPLMFPGDVRPEWMKEDIKLADRKPDLSELDEDPNGME